MHSLAVIATAYCLAGTTATGTHVAPGTVAVDPAVVPLHAHLHVTGYGYGRALDTGSAIVGKRVDVWFPTCWQARQWGRRRVRLLWWR